MINLLSTNKRMSWWIIAASVVGVGLLCLIVTRIPVTPNVVPIATLQLDDSVEAIAFSPDGKLITAGGGGRTVRRWRVSDGQVLQSIHTAGVAWYVAVSPQARYAACWYEVGPELDLWQMVTGTH